MKKLIIHIEPECKFNQQEQCEYTVRMLPKYFEYKGDKNTRITAAWQHQVIGDVPTDAVVMYHDAKDACVFSWEHK